MAELLHLPGGESEQSYSGQHPVSSIKTQFNSTGGEAHIGETQDGKPLSHRHSMHLSTFQLSPFWYTIPSSAIHVTKVGKVCTGSKIKRGSELQNSTNGQLVA